MRGCFFGIALLAGCSSLSEIAHRFGGGTEPVKLCVQRGESEYFNGFPDYEVRYPVAYSCPPKLKIRDQFATVTDQRADGFTVKSDFSNPSGSFRSVLEWEAEGQLPEGVDQPKGDFRPVSSYAANWKSLSAGWQELDRPR